jgi:putative iron-dependent peroxidase
MPQPGIFAQGSRYHHHLELDLLPEAGDHDLRRALAALLDPVGPPGEYNQVVGFGAAVWSRLAPDDLPAGLHELAPLSAPGRILPAIPHDVWVWVHAGGSDVSLDAARHAAGALKQVARVVTDQPAFIYRQSRDLTGFEDGTENPPPKQAPAVALVPDGQPGEGGSHALVIRFVHDLEAFGRLDIDGQEAVFGRTKPNSTEIAARPADSHISRVQIEAGGEELEILRRSASYGNTSELGLMFVAFSADAARYEVMLAHMYGAGEGADGLADRLLSYTQAQSGALYFAPSLDALVKLIGS